MRDVTVGEWVEALISGRYHQGRANLRHQAVIVEADRDREEARFCCLGVLCDLAGPDRWEDPGGFGEAFDWLDPQEQRWAQMPPESPFRSLFEAMSEDPLDVECLTAEWLSEVARWNDEGDNFELIAQRIDEKFSRSMVLPFSRLVPETNHEEPA